MMDKKAVKSKSGESNNQIPIWHEAFVLHFEKGNSRSNSEAEEKAF